MKTVNMHEAKTHLSRLVQQLRSGAESEIVIAVSGEPAARLVPYAGRGQRTLGIDEGLVTLAPDFDEVDATIVKLFKGKR
jgi:prevent-host-death family protein